MRQPQMQYCDKVASALQNNINAKYDNLSREVGLVNARINQSDSVVADHTKQLLGYTDSAGSAP